MSVFSGHNFMFTLMTFLLFAWWIRNFIVHLSYTVLKAFVVVPKQLRIDLTEFRPRLISFPLFRFVAGHCRFFVWYWVIRSFAVMLFFILNRRWNKEGRSFCRVCRTRHISYSAFVDRHNVGFSGLQSWTAAKRKAQLSDNKETSHYALLIEFRIV